MVYNANLRFQMYKKIWRCDVQNFHNDSKRGRAIISSGIHNHICYLPSKNRLFWSIEAPTADEARRQAKTRHSVERCLMVDRLALTQVNPTSKILSGIGREGDLPTQMLTANLDFIMGRCILDLDLGAQNVFNHGLLTVTVIGRNCICLPDMA